MNNPEIDELGNITLHNEEGYIHREDGPAVELVKGYKGWFKNGLWHREDGPAIEYPDGTKFWFYNGKRMFCDSQEEFEKIIKLKAFW